MFVKKVNTDKIRIIMEMVRDFKKITRSDASIAGGKGASLCGMTRANIPVPPGFVVLSAAFEKFLESADLNVEIDSILHAVNHKEMRTVENASEKIKDLILKAKMPQDIKEEITKEFKKLKTKFVAVRSSATAEDSSSAAWAGQLDTFLNTTEKTLLTNVQKCWASLFTHRAVFYRFEKGLHNSKISVAVVIQKMIESEVSGIAFSVHPVTQDRNQMIIEAGYGLGEAIVSGQITPDSYVIEKNPRRIIDKNIPLQERGIYRKLKEGGNEWQNIPPEKGEKQKLTDDQILELSELIIRIENHYGFPQDIEWAFENNKFYITQSRPITTLGVDEVSPDAEELLILRDRPRALAPVYWNAVLQTSQAIKENYGKALSVLYNRFIDGRMNGIVLKFEWIKMGEYIAEKLINQKGYFENIEKKTKKEINLLLIELKETNLNKLSFQNLINLAEKIRALLMEYYAASLFAWYAAGDAVKQKISARLKLYGEDLDIISLPEEKTLVNQMEKDVFESAFKNEPAEKLAKLLADEYYWIPFGYDGPDIWDNKYFTNRIKECRGNINEEKMRYDQMLKRDKKLKQKSKEILGRKNFSKEEKKLVHILRCTAVWTDERKKLEFQLFFQYRQILSELEKRYELPVINLKHLFMHELKDLDKKSKALKKISEQRMAHEFMTISEKGNIRITTGSELKKIKKIIEQQERQLQKVDIQGKIACRGSETKYIAHVKVLYSPKECSKVKKGEILVATMTTPEYIPAMVRALGFITDEGGVTSHAAISAREMNKFCVIGTKIATKVLHDGDLVEVDCG